MGSDDLFKKRREARRTAAVLIIKHLKQIPFLIVDKGERTERCILRTAENSILGKWWEELSML